MSQKLNAPELLAPAGDWECARAAIAYGADAIYFGLDVGFNARARATNFHLDDLPRLMTELHRNGLRGFVTLNTLVFTDELSALEANLRRIADAGVDAVIVQDIGAVRLIRGIAPTLHIHGSTQMTMTSAETLAGLHDLNLERVVLARELSIAEITKITSASDIPLEVFVHGALCVAYSGQCLTSESLGGRSANRGQCAQACRLNYDLICDGKHLDLDSNKYLLSPLDLAAYDHVPALMAAGVSSFKIEGRLKSPEYVANIVSHYRQAIDAVIAGEFKPASDEEKLEMGLSFTRGFTPGWLEGCNHKRLVPGLWSSKRGVRVGRVVSTRGERIIAELETVLQRGDGIVLEGDRTIDAEIGGRIYDIIPLRDQVTSGNKGRNGKLYEIALQRGTVPRNERLEGLDIYLTHSPQHSKRWRRTGSETQVRDSVPLDITVRAAVGEPIRITVGFPGGSCHLCSDAPLEVARKHAASESMFLEQLNRLGGTPYHIANLRCELEGQPMVPLSVLGDLRRRMLEEIGNRVDFTRAHACLGQDVWRSQVAMVKRHQRVEASSDDRNFAPTLHVLCRNLLQLNTICDLGVRHAYAEFHDIRDYHQAIDVARQRGIELLLTPLRIQKPGEMGLLIALHKRRSDGWLVRNLANIEYARERAIAMVGDFSLNITNPITADWFLSKGLMRITASYDLNRDQLLDLVSWLPADRLEIVIHQHMPMFHMEHCVFCTVLSPGFNKSNCGRPCDRHEVKLRDRVGTEHVLDADIGCRNTLYNGRPQSGAEVVPTLIQRGVKHFRVELLPTATAEEIRIIVPLYQDLIDGKIAGADVWRTLKADNRIGVTRGTMEQPRNPLAIL